MELLHILIIAPPFFLIKFSKFQSPIIIAPPWILAKGGCNNSVEYGNNTLLTIFI